ncbi:MAG: hypothetical protein D8M58_17900 [Calditrichaeota bacterium]|nr:MAG: hypothetical protein DWQ03_01815 [Calditrichota bacterium]MBL1207282.1 hypothetical protein [Calditrichota bacterium]NOG47114.1 hypothetical protein [Calditrichota bacterium]
MLHIEKAKKESLEEMCNVIKSSIVNLCSEDHKNQQEHLDNWLSARSEKKMNDLLFDKESQAFVCIKRGKLLEYLI